MLGALAAACSDKTEERAAGQEPAAAPEGRIPAPGTYEFTRSTGAAGLIMIGPQGRYSAAMSSGDLETGVWKIEGDLSCLVPEGGAGKLCYALTPVDARGRFRGTAEDGERITVRRME